MRVVALLLELGKVLSEAVDAVEGACPLVLPWLSLTAVLFNAELLRGVSVVSKAGITTDTFGLAEVVVLAVLAKPLGLLCGVLLDDEEEGIGSLTSSSVEETTLLIGTTSVEGKTTSPTSSSSSSSSPLASCS